MESSGPVQACNGIALPFTTALACTVDISTIDIWLVDISTEYPTPLFQVAKCYEYSISDRRRNEYGAMVE
jgi:hypothetical protein